MNQSSPWRLAWGGVQSPKDKSSEVGLWTHVAISSQTSVCGMTTRGLLWVRFYNLIGANGNGHRLIFFFHRYNDAKVEIRLCHVIFLSSI